MLGFHVILSVSEGSLRFFASLGMAGGARNDRDTIKTKVSAVIIAY